MGLISPLGKRVQDQPLHDDVRWLASTLGKVIRRIEGDECYQAVESLRLACRDRRRGDPDAPSLDDLLAQVDSYPLDLAAKVARAFTLFFLLINTAEQVHRVRRRRHYEGLPNVSPQPASFQWALERMRAEGYSADKAAEMLSRLDIRPVLTAHPTEATRRTILRLQARVSECLLERDRAGVEERKILEERLEAEIELLWLTASVRRDRPTVLDEIETVLWYLENRLMDAGSRLMDSLGRAYRHIYGRDLDIGPPLSLGSWVGGDRDGNPYVTAGVTVEAAMNSARTVLGVYRREIKALGEKLSISRSIGGVSEVFLTSVEEDRRDFPGLLPDNGTRYADEVVRLKLFYMQARLRLSESRMHTDALQHSKADKGKGYPDAAAFERDLMLVREALDMAGARHAIRHLLDPLIVQVRMCGFRGYALDIREDSKVHEEVIDDISRATGIAQLDRTAMQRELLGRRPLFGDTRRLGDLSRRTIDTFRSMHRIQEEIEPGAASTYIISMCRSPEDILRVLLLARDTGLVDLASDPPVSGIDVVPLFETGEDLKNAPEVMKSLFLDAAYEKQLKARRMHQEVMVGYSDSSKDVGLIPAAWLLYLAQEKLSRECRDAGVTLTLFHGRGGTVGRGGGSPVFRALTALPPGSVEGRIKITEQGEVISQKYGLLPIAERSLEVTTTGTLLISFTDSCQDVAPADEARFREVMDRLSDLALPVYRKMVHESERLFRLFLTATPVRELSHVYFGSRPTYRESGSGTMKGIRAIPWIFGWTQIRLNVSSWLGVGTALSQVCREPGGLEVLRKMAREWCFFDDLLGKMEMICAKTDPQIARAYIERLNSGDLPLLDELEAEFQRAVDAILDIRQTRYLLMDQPLLQTSLIHRDPYLDPLSLLQISLLQRKRAMKNDDPDRVLLDRALGTTLNGIAQGLRNTG